MAAFPTLLDIAKANGSDKVVGLIDEAHRAVPEIDSLAARTISSIERLILAGLSGRPR